MQLSNNELQEFRDRCLQAKVYGYTIALADLYMAALAQEVGQEIVPEGVEKGSADHLFGLAEEALAGRASGKKKSSKKAPKVETAPKVEEDPPVTKKDPEPAAKADDPPPPAKDEAPALKEEAEDDKKGKKSSSKK